jgi:hypothetical protein
MKKASYDLESPITTPLRNPPPLPNRQKLSPSYGADGRGASPGRSVSGANSIPAKLDRGVQWADKPKQWPEAVMHQERKAGDT